VKGGTLTPALWCLAAAALFGASTPLSKALLSSLGPFSLAGLLYLGAAGAVLPFVRERCLTEQGRQWGNCWRLAGAVVAGGVLAPVTRLPLQWHRGARWWPGRGQKRHGHLVCTPHSQQGVHTPRFPLQQRTAGETCIKRCQAMDAENPLTVRYCQAPLPPVPR
jgi:hypothetical protein